jgi:hypothetical protein
MTVMIEMPLAVYQGLLGRCLLSSREYEILKNSVITHRPQNMVEFLCGADDAKLLLTRAKLFYPVAASCIEEGIRLVREPSSRPSQIEYRKTIVGDAWHFCSDCTQWPMADFASSNDVSDNSAVAVCNECLVKVRLMFTQCHN